MLRAAVLLLILLHANSAFANGISDFYAACIKSFDFSGEAGITAVSVTPIGPVCKQRCEEECGKQTDDVTFIGGLSRKTASKGVELNADVILQCLTDCQTGQASKNYFILEDRAAPGTSPDIHYIGPVQNSVACTTAGATSSVTDTTANAIWTGVPVTANENIKVYPVSSGFHNKVYRCGKKSVTIKPLIQSNDPTVWADNTIQNLWTDPSRHFCLVPGNIITQSQFDALSNKKLWDPTLSPFDPKSICMWNARNSSYIDTGVYIKNNDEFSITWTGDYDAYGTRNNLVWNRYNLFTLINDINTDPAVKRLATDAWSKNSGLQISPVGNTNYLGPANSAITIFGESARLTSLSSIGMRGVLGGSTQTAAPIQWNGLYGRALDSNVGYITITDPTNCGNPDQIDANFNVCHRTVNPGIGIYNFGGKLTGFSATPVPLRIRNWDVDPLSNYADNLGGYQVDITYGGCPGTNGEGLEYAVLENYKDADTLASQFSQVSAANLVWREVPTEVLRQEMDLTVEATGMLLFRIGYLSVPSLQDPHVVNDYHPGNRFGDYVIAIKKAKSAGFLCYRGPLRNMVKFVRDTLFGNPTIEHYPNARPCTSAQPTSVDHLTRDGVVKILYNSFIANSGFKSVIRTFLAMYFAFLGIGFITGAVQMTQREAIIRSFNVAMVIALISDKSWDLINTYFFPFFVDGTATLISYFVMGALKNAAGFTEEMIAQDPTLVFAIFDGTWTQIISKSVWIKIGTLLLGGVTGFWVCFMILMSMYYYAVAIVKTLLMFMMALIVTAILMVVSPIFIPLALFNQTKELFDNWWKSLINFAIQPIALFTGIAIFQLLFTIAFIVTFSFTVCPICKLSLSLPEVGYSYCLIPGYIFLDQLHVPDSYNDPLYLPMGILFSSITMLILAHAMEKFVDFIPQIISSIVAGNLTSRATNIAGYGTSARIAVVGAAGSGAGGVAYVGSAIRDNKIKANTVDSFSEQFKKSRGK